MALAPANARIYGLASQWRLSLPTMGRLLRYGAPQGVHFFLEGGAITVFVMLMGGISENASAATAIAFSVNMVAFVPVIGLGIGLTTLVGREIGRQQIPFARRATRSALVLGTIYAAVFAALYFFAPMLFVGVHQWNSPIQKQEIATARWLLQFVALYCVFDSYQILFQAAIKGAGDTFFVLVVSVISSTLFVLAGMLGASMLVTEPAKLCWWWSCLTIWILALNVTYMVRYLRGKWTRMSVIEPELIHGHAG
jgi:MATE family multidrug resistance protein